MSDTMKIIAGILGIILAAVGVGVVYLAPRIVKRKGLDQQKKVDTRIAENLTEEELAKYKSDGAILDVKLKGMALAVPGFILILIAFR